MKLDTEFIEKLAKIVSSNGLTEISLEDEGQAITIRKENQEVMVAAPVQQVSAVSVEPKTAVEEPKQEKAVTGYAITSPMVGTFYSSPSPDAEAFVEIGSTVNKGDVVCIIEAMKLMNEIKSDFSGKVTQICVKNGDPIEYGQVLMYVD